MAAKTLKLRLEDMMEITPLTPNQRTAYEAYEDGNSLVLAGSAGTGKTFMALSWLLKTHLTKKCNMTK